MAKRRTKQQREEDRNAQIRDLKNQIFDLERRLRESQSTTTKYANQNIALWKMSAFRLSDHDISAIDVLTSASVDQLVRIPGGIDAVLTLSRLRERHAVTFADADIIPVAETPE